MSQSYHTRDALGKIFADIERSQRFNQVRLVQIQAPPKRRPIPERLPVLLYACLLAVLLSVMLP